MSKKIGIVTPVYNEEACIKSFVSAIDNDVISKAEKDKYNFVIIFVDDGSKDKTLEEIKSYKRDDVKFVSFSKNFGKESALYAGLEASKSLNCDATIIMDVDLQDPPEIIPEMLKKYEEGYLKIVAKQKKQHCDSRLMKVFTTAFYFIFSLLTGFKEIKHGSRDFSLLDRKVVDAYLTFNDTKRFTKGISESVGFKSYIVEFEYKKRAEGTSKWNFVSLFKYAIVGISNFSRFLIIIPRTIALAYTGLLIYDVYYYCCITDDMFGPSLDNSLVWIRQDCIILVVCILVSVVMKMLYDNKDLLLNRKRFFIEDSNIESN